MTENELRIKRTAKRMHREAKLEAKAISRQASLMSRVSHHRKMFMDNIMVKPMLGVLMRDGKGKVVRPTFWQAVWYWIKYPFRSKIKSNEAIPTH